MSAGLTDTCSPELCSLEEATPKSDERPRASQAGVAKIHGRGDLLGGARSTHGRGKWRRTSSTKKPHRSSPPPPSTHVDPAERDITIFQSFAEMQERFQRFSTMLRIEPLSSTGQIGASTVGAEQCRNDPDGASASRQRSAVA